MMQPELYCMKVLRRCRKLDGEERRLHAKSDSGFEAICEAAQLLRVAFC